MSEQSEALRLAEKLDVGVFHSWNEASICLRHAADVLRRQHSRIEADEALMRQALGELQKWTDGSGVKPGYEFVDAAITALRTRLETTK